MNGDPRLPDAGVPGDAGETAAGPLPAAGPPSPTGTGSAASASGRVLGSGHVMDPLERTVQRVLQAGVVLSLALMIAGVVLALAHGERLAVRVTPPGELAAGLAGLESAAYVSLGLMVLIATPFVRVAGSLFAFVRLRDRRYALVTAVVLLVMCASIVLGKA